jgi:hypothetical protein
VVTDKELTEREIKKVNALKQLIEEYNIIN